ncbi:50S ribosomal protein L3 N(5)-glutamine methyltransferase [Pseudoteredinibacter isoporae]|uniref:Ribosomal protein uL3 glutamine methyltransferase n=1 Tax=Pseudoteredinibacter isoporae TaxID=570281 RepID=A0A7X0JY22_9GAMM|nr:50S ribosomal protein L3 N(5)-glutamine methyltransferase [Pseudoteredinibacter isoporae]MBB6523371.1 ribosomal protein L3 glutamine methyltransferase [Pseudoteredinibacter isoporae]NHO88883.1 50S ribosomal protein L3 N(5)-glutamine methyltransferase [Pseudoteredinibacter isoporae]NIB24409.1 50S ribosomal protein L3 N(5)-glutamine methyltransferase [Pseudoteredinibacter isoporae]
MAVEQDLHTIRDYIRWAASRFSEAELYFGHGTDNAWDEATALVLQTLHLPWDTDKDTLSARLSLTERKLLVERIERRVNERLPVAYLTGQAYFCGLSFAVSEDVLVPRSPIAELIEQSFQPWLQEEPSRILDLCTGSGCIGIACAYAFEWAEVDLSDISPAAIQMAEKNIARHQLADRVRAVESDLFAGLTGERYDLIVSNPPYVNAEDLASMPEEYQQEPEIALGSGEDGLDFTRRLLAEAAEYLNDGGALIVEVGNSWPALEKAFPELPFTWIEFERGGHGVCLLFKEQLAHL